MSYRFASSQESAPSYQQAPTSSFDPSTPPPPPPKPLNHEASRRGTPQSGPPLPRPPPSESSQYSHQQQQQQQQQYRPAPQEQIAGNVSQLPAPPEGGWLPDILKEKPKSELSQLLSSPALLSALIHSPTTTHPSLPASLQPLQAALQTNIHLAQQVLSLATQLTHLRSKAESQLLHLHALERQWRQKQSALDDALEPFSPKALYQRLAMSIGEQEQVCEALEESFLEGEGRAGDRDVGEFLKRYREGSKVVWIRRERKERWDEGRVGGWR